MTPMDIVASDFWMEEVDLADETILRRIVETVDGVIGVPARFPVNVLTAEQWHVAVTRLVPPRLRQGLMRHFHVLPDPRTPGQIFVGPSTLAGLNEQSRPITAEVVYAIIQSRLPDDVPPVIARGLADIIATETSVRLDVPFFTHNYAAESHFVALLIDVLRCDWGYDSSEWIREWVQQPKRCLLALRKGAFGAVWIEAIASNEACASIVAGPRKRESLIAALIDPERPLEDDFMRATEAAFAQYLEPRDRESS